MKYMLSHFTFWPRSRVVLGRTGPIEEDLPNQPGYPIKLFDILFGLLPTVTIRDGSWCLNLEFKIC
jgi:hypothetical protein